MEKKEEEYQEIIEIKDTFICPRAYKDGEFEFNLKKMIKATIREAFDKYPEKNIFQISQLLGISDKSLYNYMKIWNIPRKLKKDK